MEGRRRRQDAVDLQAPARREVPRRLGLQCRRRRLEPREGLQQGRAAVRPAPGLAGPAAPAVDRELQEARRHDGRDQDQGRRRALSLSDAVVPGREPGQLGEAGQGLEQGGVGAVGHRPVQARPPGAARARRAGEERGLLEPQAHGQDRQAGAGLRARGFQPHRGAAVELGRHDRDAAARCGGAAEAVGHAHRAERDAARLELPSLDAAGLAVDRHPAAQGGQPRDRPRRHRQAFGRPRQAGAGPGRPHQPVVRQAHASC